MKTFSLEGTTSMRQGFTVTNATTAPWVCVRVAPTSLRYFL